MKMKPIHPSEYQNLLARCHEVVNSASWQGEFPQEIPNPWESFPQQNVSLPDGDAELSLYRSNSMYGMGWSVRCSTLIRGRTHWMSYDSHGGVQSIGVIGQDHGVTASEVHYWVMTAEEMASQRPHF